MFCFIALLFSITWQVVTIICFEWSFLCFLAAASSQFKYAFCIYLFFKRIVVNNYGDPAFYLHFARVLVFLRQWSWMFMHSLRKDNAIYCEWLVWTVAFCILFGRVIQRIWECSVLQWWVGNKFKVSKAPVWKT